MKILNKLTLLLVAICCMFSSVAFAESWYSATHDEDQFTLGLAYLYRDRPYIGYENKRKHNIIPVIGYQSEKFFIEGRQLGFKAYNFEDANLRFDLVGEYVNLGYRESDSDFLSGNDQRRDSFELGGRLLWQPNDWGLSLYGGYDVSTNSDGAEVRGNAFYRYKYDRWTVTPHAYVAWQSSNKVGYYYGVRGKDATLARPAYSGNDTWNQGVGLNVSYKLYKGWTALASGQYEHYGREIRNSSIVDSDHQWSSILGLAYTF